MEIALFQDDLSVVRVPEANREFYDLELLDPYESLNMLVRRALETPAKYIAEWVNQENGLIWLDRDYGNEVYSRLSDPLTTNWISDANTYIRQALKKLDSNIQVSSVDIQAVDLDKVSIIVSYSISGTNYLTSLDVGI